MHNEHTTLLDWNTLVFDWFALVLRKKTLHLIKSTFAECVLCRYIQGTTTKSWPGYGVVGVPDEGASGVDEVPEHRVGVEAPVDPAGAAQHTHVRYAVVVARVPVDDDTDVEQQVQHSKRVRGIHTFLRRLEELYQLVATQQPVFAPHWHVVTLPKKNNSKNKSSLE